MYDGMKFNTWFLISFLQKHTYLKEHNLFLQTFQVQVLTKISIVVILLLFNKYYLLGLETFSYCMYYYLLYCIVL